MLVGLGEDGGEEGGSGQGPPAREGEGFHRFNGTGGFPHRNGTGFGHEGGHGRFPHHKNFTGEWQHHTRTTPAA